MRRPVMYLAGLLLATGASLALAGPASAAPASPATPDYKKCELAQNPRLCWYLKHRYQFNGYPYGGYQGYQGYGYGLGGGSDADVLNTGVYSTYSDSSVDQYGLVNLNGGNGGLLNGLL